MLPTEKTSYKDEGTPCRWSLPARHMATSCRRIWARAVGGVSSDPCHPFMWLSPQKETYLRSSGTQVKGKKSQDPKPLFRSERRTIGSIFPREWMHSFLNLKKNQSSNLFIYFKSKLKTQMRHIQSDKSTDEWIYQVPTLCQAQHVKKSKTRSLACWGAVCPHAPSQNPSHLWLICPLLRHYNCQIWNLDRSW